MTILRVITDIEVSEVPSDEDVEKVTTLFTQFSHGVVTAVELSADDESNYTTGHIHVSNEDYSCKTCVRAGKDGRS